MDGPMLSFEADSTANTSGLGLPLEKLNMTSHSAAPVEPNYEYSALDSTKKEIRVLKLRPGERSDSITCTIEHVSLLDDPYYETISYCWGDNPASVKIIADGCLLLVPYSSAAVLRRLRHVQEERTFWIDAVCIDQESLAERSAQVAMMGDVFSMSKRTWIDLGDVDMRIAQAGIRALNLVLKEARDATNDLVDLDRTVYSDKGQLLTHKQGLGDDIDIAALEGILLSPWFKRVWVMQEAALAQQATCACGEGTVDLIDVVRAIIWLQYKRHWLPRQALDSPGLEAGARLWDYIDLDHGGYTRHRKNGSSVVSALKIAIELDSSEDKDRVFGVLGLMRCTRQAEGVPKLLVPDYTKSLLDVYRDATRYAIAEQARHINPIFNQIRHTSREDIQQSGWLSWVPHLQVRYNGYVLRTRLGRHFSAAKHREQSCESILAPIDSNILSLKGICADEIRQYSVSLPADADAGVTLRWVDQVQDLAGHQKQHALAYVLLGGSTTDRQPATAEDCAGFDDYMTFLRDGHFPPAVQELQSSDSDHVKRASRFNLAFIDACWNRRLFVTSKGLMGIGPKILETGDSVVLLYGADTPSILRKWGKHWKILGEAYVHGIMYGEAMDEHEASGKPDETFHLC